MHWKSSPPMFVQPPPRALQTERSRFLFKLGPCFYCSHKVARPPNYWRVKNRLTANYAPYPDGNVPRQGLYFSYRRVCDQYGIPHINTATLGKAIRLCFPTIKTRRLGVRGNSKYHCTSHSFDIQEHEFDVLRHIHQIAASALPLLLRLNGFRITFTSRITMRPKRQSMLLVLVMRPMARIAVRIAPTRTTRTIQRAITLALDQSATLSSSQER